MPYQEQIAQAFANRGYEPIWFPFSGQPGASGGVFSIRAGADDLDRVIDRVDALLGQIAGPTSILAHCASSLIAVEYLRQHPHSGIAKLIAYSPLIEPRRIKSRAESRLAEAGVCSGLTDWDWDYNIQDIISSLSKLPVLLCHIGDTLNRKRATLPELYKIAKVLPYASVISCPHGYDHRSSDISNFIDLYDNWLR